MAAIEHLVYTWSDIGLSGQVAGFRIRAASRGLSDELSMRYKNLKGYLHYDLPEGVRARSLRASEAPVCLALINTGQERILVRRELLDADGMGRPGAYLTHLLAGLPANFSAREAILLWGDSLWVTSKNPLKPHQLLLEPVAEERLFTPRSVAWRLSSPENFAAALFLALAHFRRSSPPYRVYLSGHSTSIAELIWGITQSLPRACLQEMTFSTYEASPDVSDETIVGLFSEQYLPSGEGAFNVDEASKLPPPTSEKLVKLYSKFAARALYQRMQTSSRQNDPLAVLITQAEQENIRNIEGLLQLYQTYRKEQQDLQEQMEREEMLKKQRLQESQKAISVAQPVGQTPLPGYKVPAPVQPILPQQPQQPSSSAPYFSPPVEEADPVYEPGETAEPPLAGGIRGVVAQFTHQLNSIRSLSLLHRGVQLSLFLNGFLLLALLFSLIALQVRPSGPNPPNSTPILQPTATKVASTPGNDVTFLSTLTNTPEAKAKESFSLAVEVHNSGSTTWTAQDKYQLECIPDPHPDQKVDQDCPKMKVMAPVGVDVPSQHNYLFAFTFSSPGPSGSHTLKVQMFQGNQPFGPTQILNFTIAS